MSRKEKKMNYIPKTEQEKKYIDQLSKFVKNYMESVSFEKISKLKFGKELFEHSINTNFIYSKIKTLDTTLFQNRKDYLNLLNIVEGLGIDIGEIDDLIANKELFDEIWETAYKQQEKMEFFKFLEMNLNGEEINIESDDNLFNSSYEIYLSILNNDGKELFGEVILYDQIIDKNNGWELLLNKIKKELKKEKQESKGQ